MMLCYFIKKLLNYEILATSWERDALATVLLLPAPCQVRTLNCSRRYRAAWGLTEHQLSARGQ